MKESRINKWRNYRNTIIENENLDVSIINSDPELKKMLNKVNLDPETLLRKNKKLKKESENLNFKAQEDNKKIDSIINLINENESMKNTIDAKWDSNTHTYDQIIKDNFSDLEEEIKKEKEQEKTTTTNIKVNKLII